MKLHLSVEVEYPLPKRPQRVVPRKIRVEPRRVYHSPTEITRDAARAIRDANVLALDVEEEGKGMRREKGKEKCELNLKPI